MTEMIRQFVVLLLFLTSHIDNVYSARILGLFNTPSKSHMFMNRALMKRLAENGHEVTVASSFPLDGRLPPNYRDIHISIESSKFEQNVVFPKLMKAAETDSDKIWTTMKYVFSLGKRMEDSINHPEMLKLKNETFDLLILGYFMNDLQLGLAAHFNCPVVIACPRMSSIALRRFTGSTNGISYIPTAFQSIDSLTTFYGRLQNLCALTFEYLFTLALDYFIHIPIYERNFPSNQYPTLDEARQSVSLVLTNYHFSQGIVEPLFPSVIQVGGLHITAPNESEPLPTDIQEFLDSAIDGAIFFSLGSNVRSVDLSQEKFHDILNVFSGLKQKVLWKLEDENLMDYPKNIMIRKWFPQNSILAHSNTKLFISHCGLGSVNEAIYFGVPILAIPIFGDQPGNADKVTADGWALQLKLTELNKTTLSMALNEILTNPMYSNRIQELSALYKDRPQRPIDEAIFWIEYVIRHKGAKHFQSPAVHLNVIQYYSLDVITFLLFILYICVKMLKWIGSLLIRRIFVRSKLKRH